MANQVGLPTQTKQEADHARAIYTRVSIQRQAQTQTIEQQLERLQAHVVSKGWTLEAENIYRADGYSGAKLNRPGLDSLRDRPALAEFDLVLITAPDRLARNYVHQMLIIEELRKRGLQVEFLDRPMSDDPHDQLLLQIWGAVAEYERTLTSPVKRYTLWVVNPDGIRAVSRLLLAPGSWLYLPAVSH